MKIIKTNKQTKTFETFCCCLVTLERSDQYPPPPPTTTTTSPRDHIHTYTHIPHAHFTQHPPAMPHNLMSHLYRVRPLLVVIKHGLVLLLSLLQVFRQHLDLLLSLLQSLLQLHALESRDKTSTMPVLSQAGSPAERCPHVFL